MSVIEVKNGFWVHSHDLGIQVPGREDSAEDRDACVAYLRALQASRKGVGSAERAQMTQADLAAAQIRAIATADPRDADLLAQVEHQEQELAEAKLSIDRLLVFVLARASAIPTTRLLELVTELLDATAKNFPRACSTTQHIVPEDDEETQACHRVHFTVVVPSDEDFSSVASGVHAVHMRLAEVTTAEERRAIRLIVEVDQAA